MSELKYKVGDKVRVNSIDWYNENKNEDDSVWLTATRHCKYNFIEPQSNFCGKVMTISSVNNYSYNMVEDNGEYFWTDEMIEGLVEEETKPKYEDEVNGEYYSTPKYLVRPSGYQFVDENGNILNARKIVLEKKKKEYPKTYEECCKIFGLNHYLGLSWNSYDEYSGVITGLPKRIDDIAKKLESLSKLIICRDAYWKLYGEEMGLNKPWEPDYSEESYEQGSPIKYVIYYTGNNITKGRMCKPSYILSFPTEEMRDYFYENFKEEIESCKEFL